VTYAVPYAERNCENCWRLTTLASLDDGTVLCYLCGRRLYEQRRIRALDTILRRRMRLPQCWSILQLQARAQGFTAANLLTGP
jgi:hypothetical protein